MPNWGLFSKCFEEPAIKKDLLSQVFSGGEGGLCSKFDNYNLIFPSVAITEILQTIE